MTKIIGTLKKGVNKLKDHMHLGHCFSDDSDSGGYGSDWSFRGRAALCSVVLATGLSNTLRLPREAHAHGGLPFLTAHTILAILCGLPLLYLKLALGKFVEQGAIKMWRVVPFLKGIGYVKLLAGFMVAVYYMIYISLTSAMFIWTTKGPVPLAECRELHRGIDGYHVNGTSGYQCMNKTFLKSVFDDPMWYAIIAAITFTLWLLIPICLIKVPNSFQKSMFFFGSITLTLSLIVVLLKGLDHAHEYFLDPRWDMMLSTNLWCSAFVQLLFSTHLGFGYLITAGGSIYSKSSVLWSAISLMAWNVGFGWLSILMWHGTESFTDVDESSALMVLIDIYNSSVFKDISSWSSFAYLLLISSGFSSVLAFLYPIVSCLDGEAHCNKRIVVWIIAIAGLFASLAIFVLGLDIINLLDRDVVPVYILGSLLLEISALFLIYGVKSIKQDLEFTVQNKLSYVWFFTWLVVPFVLLIFITWKVSDYVINYARQHWTFWVIFSLTMLAIIQVIIWAMWVIMRKEDYGFCQKLMSAMKPSRKWGPVDPISRHKWLQYKSFRKNSKRRQIKVARIGNVVHYKNENIVNNFMTVRCTKDCFKINDIILQKSPNRAPPCCANGRPSVHCMNESQKRHEVYHCEVNYYGSPCWIKDECSTEF